jgi:hypothetical protein
MEGVFGVSPDPYNPYCFVFRYGDACCGNPGFVVTWPEDHLLPYPDSNAWVQATGELKSYYEDDIYEVLYLELSSLTELSKRGQEYVRQ